MLFTYQLFTPGVVWPPLESINWAINSQAVSAPGPPSSRIR